MTNSTCAVDGCAKPTNAKGLCSGHYWRAQRGKPLDTPFRTKVVATCEVVDCPALVRCKGLCKRHYTRLLNHGDPLGGGPDLAPDGAGLAFALGAANYEGDDCLPYPYGKNDRGYGHFAADGKRVYAHRYVLTLTAGPPPFPRAVAAHAPLVCHNPACVNPRHLRWASQAENAADMKIDGTYSKPPNRYAARWADHPTTTS